MNRRTVQENGRSKRISSLTRTGRVSSPCMTMMMMIMTTMQLLILSCIEIQSFQWSQIIPIPSYVDRIAPKQQSQWRRTVTATKSTTSTSSRIINTSRVLSSKRKCRADTQLSVSGNSNTNELVRVFVSICISLCRTNAIEIEHV
jgi:hypothetical protein